MPRKYTRKIRRRRVKGGSQEFDIEMGTVADIPPMDNIPADPLRFDEQNKQIVRDSLFNPISNEETAAVFDGPTPEEKELINNNLMKDEDNRYINPYARSDFKIFRNKGGLRKTKKRRGNKRKNTRRRRR